MKQLANEPYESWAARVQVFEYNIALRRIAAGDDIILVMEKMSQRIVDKLLYPIYQAIANVDYVYNTEQSRRDYQKNYLDKVPRAADHINDQTI